MTTVCERVDQLVPTPSRITRVSQGNRRPLPATIAIASDHALLLKGLSLGARNVLSEIARHLKKANPLGSVFPKKATIAERLGIHERSVYRHLNELDSAGIIEREEQKHRKGTGIGEFLTGHIKLTKKGAAYLGLIPWERPVLDIASEDDLTIELSSTSEQAAKSARSEVIPNEPSAKMAVHNKSLTEPKLSALKRSAPEAMATVPAELTWLLRAGVKVGEIFFLMGLASKHQKRLSDISEAKRDTLLARGMKGRDLKAYLMALAKSEVCFKTLASNARQAVREAEERAVHERATTVFKARFAGITLASKDLSRLHLIDEQCAFARTWDGCQWSLAPMQNLKPWMAGLESGNLILATQEIETRIRNRVQSATEITSPVAVKNTQHRPTTTGVQSACSTMSNGASIGAIKSIRALLANAGERGGHSRNLKKSLHAS